MTKKVDRAGMIPFYVNDDNEVVMMFMIPSDHEYGGSQFQIAKGKVDPGETHEGAAIREAEEELGLLQTNYASDVHFLGQYLGRMYIYIVEINSLINFNQPHHETAQVGWLTLEQFKNIGRELHEPLVYEAERYIREKMIKDTPLTSRDN